MVGKPGKNFWSVLRGVFSRSAPGRERRPYTATFSAPMLAGACVVLACAIGWAFFMGLMVGRGQNPAARINDLTGGLLESEAPASPPKNIEPPSVATASEPPAPGVERERPRGEALEAWPAPQKSEAPKPRREPERARQESAKSQASYDFVYQVAAVKSAKDAETLNKKLKGLGLRSETRKSGKVYLLVVSLRGKDSDALAMRDKLRSAKLGKPLLLSKKERTTRQANKR